MLPVLSAAVVTVSDSCYCGERADISGPAVVELLRAHGFSVAIQRTVPDEVIPIAETIRTLAKEVQLVVTTGGTGISARDVTPEATSSVCDRVLDGFAERMRAEGLKQTPFAALSRAICGTCGMSLVVNLPGSPAGAVCSLQAVLGLLPHALAILSGDTEHSPNHQDSSNLTNR